ncbi:hypothetical protein [Sinorhizobium fredii]|uniref:hypothetical protein n=1 Tax=Rhizobium fredii TaxID=380 RepID=UPI00117E8045|nr:hypothetical protein [Sinorhizobium fredii]
MNLNRPAASTAQFAVVSQPPDIAAPGGGPSHRYQCRQAKAYRNVPACEADESSPEKVQVLDPCHPLYGRSFYVIREVVRGGNFPPSYEVEHHDGSTLLIPVTATQGCVEGTNQIKLSVEAVRDLIAVAETLEGHDGRSEEPVGDVITRVATSNSRRHRRSAGGGVS